MATLRDLFNIGRVSDFEILDYESTAHYRYDGDKVLLGGDPTSLSWSELINFEVRSIEPGENVIKVWL